MLVFATSDKGGTGRSVTSSNVLYRLALQGKDVCYLDFDFGSPTAGSIFNIDSALRGTSSGGLHSYLLERIAEAERIEVWTESARPSLRTRPDGAGRMTLLPGDAGGGEFPYTPQAVRRCIDLMMRVEEEYDLAIIDLSAGRSHATQIVLAATAAPEMADVATRWLVFHRWTRQHVIAAAGLVHGERGLLDIGKQHGHDLDELTAAIRFVRTAVVNPDGEELAGLRAAQIAWLRECNSDLHLLARQLRVGRTAVLGDVPLDPVLQWREQLISDSDIMTRQVANLDTVDAFDSLAARLLEPWDRL